jgi:hypothetical protein
MWNFIPYIHHGREVFSAGTQLLKLENASPPQAALIQRQVGPTNLHRGSLWRTSRDMMSYWKTEKKNMKNPGFGSKNSCFL